MLHQALLLAQPPTDQQGSQGSFTLTRLNKTCFRKIQVTGLLLELLRFLLITLSLLAVAVEVLTKLVVVVQVDFAQQLITQAAVEL
jgi:hypothetical protein